MAGAGVDPERPNPSPFVLRHLPGVPAGGRVLDVACGGGRHLRAALDRGHPVTGVDRTLWGVADLAGRAGVELIEADLERGEPPPFAGRRFAGVVVTRYLWRPILADVVAAVAEDGVLIYETFALGQRRGDRPVREAFALRPNELAAAALAGGLVVVDYEHGVIGGDPACDHAHQVLQRIAAVGPAHPYARPETPRPLDRP